MRALLHVLAARIRSLFRGDDLDGDFDLELRSHLAMAEEDKVRLGLTRAEARRAARVELGGLTQLREARRAARGLAFVDTSRQDLRVGLRGLARNPGFTATVLLTLSIGIGATTAMFSVVNGVLLQPLPYPEQDRLIELVHEAPAIGIDQVFASPAAYFGYRDHGRTFEAVGLWDWDRSPVTVTGSRSPEAVPSVEVTHELLEMLGADPILGRSFIEADDLPGSAPTAVISYAFWQRYLDGIDPLGQTLIVDGTPRQVIGVLPRSFRFFDYPADLFYPLQPVRSEARFPASDGRGIARLRPGVSLAEASADVARMIAILDEEYPGGSAEALQFGPKLRWLKESVVGDLGDTLWVLMGTVGLLLVIACANVANLTLVRAEARRPELAVRAALGGGWASIARLAVTESAMVAVAGSIGGLALAYAGLSVRQAIGGRDLPHVMTVTIDPTVLAVTAGISLLATVSFALVPVLHVARGAVPLARAVRGGGRSNTGGRESGRVRHLLVVSQVALTLVLLVGSALMLQTFQALRRVDPGFHDPAGVQTFQLTIPAADLPGEGAGGFDPEALVRLQGQILERLAAAPGVEAAAFASFNDGLPLDGDNRAAAISVEGRPSGDEAPALREVQFVSPGFFETLRTPVLVGRAFDWDDVRQRRRVVLVSENLARAEWGAAGDALGQRLAVDSAPPWSEVVGVVKDVHHDGLSRPAPEVVVFPAVGSATAAFVVRSARAGTTAFERELQAAVWSLNPTLALANVETLGDLYLRSLARTTTTLQLLATAGAVALLLGLVGIYGVVSYAVSERRREIGIRLALGARNGEVRRMFVGRALVLVGAGVAIGLVASAWLARLMSSLVHGVEVTDPATFAAVAVALTAIGLAGSYLPALRASKTDPVETLRLE